MDGENVKVFTYAKNVDNETNVYFNERDRSDV